MKNKELVVFLAMLSMCGCTSSRYKVYDDEDYTILSTSLQNPYVEIENVNTINVDWLDGVVYFKTSKEASNIQIYEDFYDYKPSKSEYARYKVDSNVLDVKFSKPNIRIVDEVSKDLYVILPSNYYLDSVYVNSVSSNIVIDDVYIDKINIAQVSGNNNIYAKTSLIEIKSVSANTDIYLKNDENFDATFDTLSGKFNSEILVTSKDNVYTHLSYSAWHLIITCQTTSGNLNIKKYEELSD